MKQTAVTNGDVAAGRYHEQLNVLENVKDENDDDRFAVHIRAIQNLERTVDSLVTYVQQLEKSVGYAGNFSSLNLNSLYVDRFPRTSADFEGWDVSNRNTIYEIVKDREFHRLFDMAMAFIAGSPPPYCDGDYLEFGCCGAGSFLTALAKARKWHLNNMNFYAFDSFEGLPTDGTLAFGLDDFWKLVHEQGVYVDKVTAIKGFYKDTLTDELQQEFLARKRKVAFANVDCDLHESAIPVFNFLSPLLAPGSIVNLDDFYGTFQHGYEFGTALAFFDFCKNHPTLGFYPFMRTGVGCMSYIAYDRATFQKSPLI